jgi:hypothetical protein
MVLLRTPVTPWLGHPPWSPIDFRFWRSPSRRLAGGHESCLPTSRRGHGPLLRAGHREMAPVRRLALRPYPLRSAHIPYLDRLVVVVVDPSSTVETILGTLSHFIQTETGIIALPWLVCLFLAYFLPFVSKQWELTNFGRCVLLPFTYHYSHFIYSYFSYFSCSNLRAFGFRSITTW